MDIFIITDMSRHKLIVSLINLSHVVHTFIMIEGHVLPRSTLYEDSEP